MNQLNIIYKQIKINSKLFILVNTIFLIILILFYDFSQNKKTNKYNFKITLEYDKTFYNMNRFNITSFSNKALFKNFKKNRIYLEKQIYFPQMDTYYLFILDDDLNSAKNLFEKKIKDFEISFYKKRDVLIKSLQNKNEHIHNENIEEKKNYIELVCPSLIKKEITSCDKIYKNSNKIVDNLSKISKSQLESFNHEYLNEYKNINFSPLEEEYKLFLIIYLFLILNFLIIFNQKIIPHKV